jgi:hypothetical protein
MRCAGAPQLLRAASGEAMRSIGFARVALDLQDLLRHPPLAGAADVDDQVNGLADGAARNLGFNLRQEVFGMRI